MEYARIRKTIFQQTKMRYITAKKKEVLSSTRCAKQNTTKYLEQISKIESTNA